MLDIVAGFANAKSAAFLWLSISYMYYPYDTASFV